MNATQYARVKTVFAAALDKPEKERIALVRQQCGDDEQILQEVLSLLRHHHDKTIFEVAPRTPLPPSTFVNPTERVDPFLVLIDVWEENRQILRRRLMVIACVLSVFVVISMVRLFTYEHAALGYGIRITSLSIYLGCVLLLHRKPNLTLFQLRATELLVMGNAILLIIILCIRLMLDAAGRGDYITLISANNWNYFIVTLLVFVYGVFMPNTWQRAAAVLLPIAAIPNLISGAASTLQPSILVLMERDEFGRPIPAPLITACISIYAAHLIHGSRLSSFKARRLAQYQLKRLIGEGGMGQVFEAEHLLLKRPCAIKLIQPERSLDGNALQSFEREVRATAKLTHPHTIEVYDYGQTREGLFFCAMELLPGMSLGELVQRFGPLPPARAVHFLLEVCEALQEAHDAGLIHRDIKPANIFASQIGGICDFTKLLDFGLVRQTQVDQPQEAMSGLIAGTPDFMSPEQVATPAHLDARTDIYSLGAVGYFLLTGRPPLTADSPLESMLALIDQNPVSPSVHQPGIPNDLEQVIMRCLVKEPTLRTASAMQLHTELEQCTCARQWTQREAKQWWSQHGRA